MRRGGDEGRRGGEERRAELCFLQNKSHFDRVVSPCHLATPFTSHLPEILRQKPPEMTSNRKTKQWGRGTVG